MDHKHQRRSRQKSKELAGSVGVGVEQNDKRAGEGVGVWGVEQNDKRVGEGVGGWDVEQNDKSGVNSIAYTDGDFRLENKGTSR